MTVLNRIRHLAGGATTLVPWLGTGMEVVEQSEAQLRATICLACPLNRDGIKMVDDVAGRIHKTVEAKNNIALRVVGEEHLKTCAVCLCSLPLKVWLPIERIRLGILPSDVYPSHCWVPESKP